MGQEETNNNENNNNININTSSHIKNNSNKILEQIGREANMNSDYSFPVSRSFSSLSLGITNDLIVSKNLKSDPNESYKFSKLDLIGEGTFAKVYKVESKYTGKICAMKVIKKSETNKSHEEEKEIINEINILKKMDHPNILKIFEFYPNYDNNYSLIIEYCKDGELFDEIIRNNGAFDEKYSAYIMFQIFSGLNYLHNNMHITHRDLKPENILIADKNENGYPRIKISDFGTSLFFKKGTIQKHIVGSLFYMAPEVLNKKYDEKCDLWSCGVILYLLVSGQLPFYSTRQDEKEIKKKILTCNYSLKGRAFSFVSKNCIDLIQSLLIKKPEERITASQALEHPWFKENRSKELYNQITDKKIIRNLISNIKNYKRLSVLQETALAYLVHNYPQISDVVNACKLFNQIDINGDGKISKDEFIIGLKNKLKSNNLESDVNEIYENIDMDNNGFIEYEEFVRAAVNKEFFISDDILRFAFRFFDKDNSGEITFNEIEEVFKSNISKNENVKESLRKIIHEVDINGDGKISFDEFASVMRNMLTKKKY